MGFSSPMIFRRISGSISAGVLPYSPRTRFFVSLVTILYLSPVMTFSTACVPTICEVGVTRGTCPRSAFTLGTSSYTSASRSSFFASRSWEMRLEIIPPGIWYTSTLVSMPVNPLSKAWYFLRTDWK